MPAIRSYVQRLLFPRQTTPCRPSRLPVRSTPGRLRRVARVLFDNRRRGIT
jgi:hypothetical protein